MSKQQNKRSAEAMSPSTKKSKGKATVEANIEEVVDFGEHQAPKSSTSVTKMIKSLSIHKLNEAEAVEEKPSENLATPPIIQPSDQPKTSKSDAQEVI